MSGKSFNRWLKHNRSKRKLRKQEGQGEDGEAEAAPTMSSCDANNSGSHEVTTTNSNDNNKQQEKIMDEPTPSSAATATAAVTRSTTFDDDADPYQNPATKAATGSSSSSSSKPHPNGNNDDLCHNDKEEAAPTRPTKKRKRQRQKQHQQQQPNRISLGGSDIDNDGGDEAEQQQQLHYLDSQICPTMQNDMYNLRQDKRRLEFQVVTLQQRIQLIEQELAGTKTLNNELVGMETRRHQKFRKQRKQIDQLEQQVEFLEEENTTLKTTLEQAMHDVAGLNRQKKRFSALFLSLGEVIMEPPNDNDEGLLLNNGTHLLPPPLVALIENGITTTEITATATATTTRAAAAAATTTTEENEKTTVADHQKDDERTAAAASTEAADDDDDDETQATLLVNNNTQATTKVVEEPTNSKVAPASSLYSSSVTTYDQRMIKEATIDNTTTNSSTPEDDGEKKQEEKEFVNVDTAAVDSSALTNIGLDLEAKEEQNKKEIEGACSQDSNSTDATIDMLSLDQVVPHHQEDEEEELKKATSPLQEPHCSSKDQHVEDNTGSLHETEKKKELSMEDSSSVTTYDQRITKQAKLMEGIAPAKNNSTTTEDSEDDHHEKWELTITRSRNAPMETTKEEQEAPYDDVADATRESANDSSEMVGDGVMDAAVVPRSDVPHEEDEEVEARSSTSNSCNLATAMTATTTVAAQSLTKATSTSTSQNLSSKESIDRPSTLTSSISKTDNEVALPSNDFSHPEKAKTTVPVHSPTVRESTAFIDDESVSSDATEPHLLHRDGEKSDSREELEIDEGLKAATRTLSANGSGTNSSKKDSSDAIEGETAANTRPSDALQLESEASDDFPVLVDNISALQSKASERKLSRGRKKESSSSSADDDILWSDDDGDERASKSSRQSTLEEHYGKGKKQKMKSKDKRWMKTRKPQPVKKQSSIDGFLDKSTPTQMKHKVSDSSSSANRSRSRKRERSGPETSSAKRERPSAERNNSYYGDKKPRTTEAEPDHVFNSPPFQNSVPTKNKSKRSVCDDLRTPSPDKDSGEAPPVIERREKRRRQPKTKKSVGPGSGSEGKELKQNNASSPPPKSSDKDRKEESNSKKIKKSAGVDFTNETSKEESTLIKALEKATTTNDTSEPPTKLISKESTLTKVEEKDQSQTQCTAHTVHEVRFETTKKPSSQISQMTSTQALRSPPHYRSKTLQRALNAPKEQTAVETQGSETVWNPPESNPSAVKMATKPVSSSYPSSSESKKLKRKIEKKKEKTTAEQKSRTKLRTDAKASNAKVHRDREPESKRAKVEVSSSTPLTKLADTQGTLGTTYDQRMLLPKEAKPMEDINDFYVRSNKSKETPVKSSSENGMQHSKEHHNDKGWMTNQHARKFDKEFEEAARSDVLRPQQGTARADCRYPPARQKGKAGGKENECDDELMASDDSPDYGYVQGRGGKRASTCQICEKRDCVECRKFYEAVAKQGMGNEFLDPRSSRPKHSRHHKYSRDAQENTPPQFWEMSFIDSQKRREEALQDRGGIEDDEESDSEAGMTVEDTQPSSAEAQL